MTRRQHRYNDVIEQKVLEAKRGLQKLSKARTKEAVKITALSKKALQEIDKAKNGDIKKKKGALRTLKIILRSIGALALIAIPAIALARHKKHERLVNEQLRASQERVREVNKGASNFAEETRQLLEKQNKELKEQAERIQMEKKRQAELKRKIEEEKDRERRQRLLSELQKQKDELERQKAMHEERKQMAKHTAEKLLETKSVPYSQYEEFIRTNRDLELQAEIEMAEQEKNLNERIAEVSKGVVKSITEATKELAKEVGATKKDCALQRRFNITTHDSIVRMIRK